MPTSVQAVTLPLVNTRPQWLPAYLLAYTLHSVPTASCSLTSPPVRHRAPLHPALLWPAMASACVSPRACGNLCVSGCVCRVVCGGLTVSFPPQVVVRPYTPVSRPDAAGHLDLVIKAYAAGELHH